jgi:MYXO-CTERM domain-containing protein
VKWRVLGGCLLWSAVVHAHGPAPAVLGVLTSVEPSVCGDAGVLPGVLRTNIGLAVARGDGTYRYVCAAMWKGSALALSAADPSGAEIVVATQGAVHVSRDGAQSFDQVVGVGDSPVALVWGADGAWGVSLDFERDVSTRWSWVPGEAVGSWDLSPWIADGVVVDEAGVPWLAGARPIPWLGRFDRELEVVWSEERDLDRLTPRWAKQGDVAVLAGQGASRVLWDVRQDQVTELAGPAEVVLGPVGAWESRWAVLDGTLWSEVGGWHATPEAVDWTCLEAAGGGLWACSLGGVYALDEVDDLVAGARLVFRLEQLGPWTDAGVDEVCTADWRDNAGESGWLDSAPAVCADGVRGPLLVAPGGCGCGLGGKPQGTGAALVLGMLMGRMWRRRRSL